MQELCAANSGFEDSSMYPPASGANNIMHHVVSVGFVLAAEPISGRFDAIYLLEILMPEPAADKGQKPLFHSPNATCGTMAFPQALTASRHHRGKAIPANSPGNPSSPPHTGGLSREPVPVRYSSLCIAVLGSPLRMPGLAGSVTFFASFAVGVGKSPLTARSFNRDIYVRPDFLVLYSPVTF